MNSFINNLYVDNLTMGIVITQNAAAYQRVKKREEVIKKNIKILSRNDPDEILKIESKTRIKLRKSLLTKDVNLKALITGNEFLPINYLERGKKVSESVCLIEVKNDQGKIIKYGTGFMVSPYLLLTNNHVLKNKEDCKKSLAQFNFEDDLYFSPKKEITFSLVPDRFFYTSKSLDFTLVAASLKDLTGQISLSTFGFNKLISGSGKALIGEYVSLIHHPAKDKKQISIRENRVVDIKTIFIRYQTDSMGGSSGAPVFNDSWEVVALHHAGVPKQDKFGNNLALDGSIWDNWMGEDKLQYIFNEGIRLSKILEHLKRNKEKIPNNSKYLDNLIG